jgi:polyisoprenoid-binding protein YceI
MKRIPRIAAVLAAAAPALAFAQTSSWNLDSSHTQTVFGVKHLVITTVKGQFNKTTGTVTLDEKDVTKSKVEAAIDVASINTREPKRDDHLRSADFFDAANHPAITFRSTKVEKAGDGKLKVTGDLTMRGVTKPVTLDVTGPTAEIKDPQGNARRGISASGKLNRKDFGIAWSKLVEAGPVVGDEVSIEIEAELVKTK